MCYLSRDILIDADDFFFFCMLYACVQVRCGVLRYGCGVGVPKRLPVHPPAFAPAAPSHAAEDEGRRAGRKALAGAVWVTLVLALSATTMGGCVLVAIFVVLLYC